MNKFQAMAQIMAILCQEAGLKRKDPVYKFVREQVAQRIDILGPDAALLNIIDRKVHILDQIKVLSKWEARGKLLPIIDF